MCAVGSVRRAYYKAVCLLSEMTATSPLMHGSHKLLPHFLIQVSVRILAYPSCELSTSYATRKGYHSLLMDCVTSSYWTPYTGTISLRSSEKVSSANGIRTWRIFSSSKIPCTTQQRTAWVSMASKYKSFMHATFWNACTGTYCLVQSNLVLRKSKTFRNFSDMWSISKHPNPLLTCF